MTIEELYRKDKEKYLRLLRRILKTRNSHAEDILQEAFFKAVKNYNKYNNKWALSTWFSRILFNTLSDYMRKERRLADLDALVAMQEWEEQINYSIRINQIIDNTEDDKTREVIRLVWLCGYTPREVAKIEHISEVNVRKICQRFRSSIKERLDENSLED